MHKHIMIDCLFIAQERIHYVNQIIRDLSKIDLKCFKQKDKLKNSHSIKHLDKIAHQN